MESFLELLPHDTRVASAVARKRSAFMKGRAKLSADETRAVRHAIEIRHESFLDTSFIELLRDHNVALVIAETARRWPMTHDITADFVYMRLHGDKELYRSGYGDKALERWARRIRAWSAGSEPDDAQKVSDKKPPSSKPRDVYCFFDNTDVKLRAPFDAQTLMRKLGLTPGSPVGQPERGRAPAKRGKNAGVGVRSKAVAGAKAAPEAGAKVASGADAKAAPEADAKVAPGAGAKAPRGAGANTRRRAGAKGAVRAKTATGARVKSRTGADAKAAARTKAAPVRASTARARPASTARSRV